MHFVNLIEDCPEPPSVQNPRISRVQFLPACHSGQFSVVGNPDACFWRKRVGTSSQNLSALGRVYHFPKLKKIHFWEMDRKDNRGQQEGYR